MGVGFDIRGLGVITRRVSSSVTATRCVTELPSRGLTSSPRDERGRTPAVIQALWNLSLHIPPHCFLYCGRQWQGVSAPAKDEAFAVLM